MYGNIAHERTRYYLRVRVGEQLYEVSSVFWFDCETMRKIGMEACRACDATPSQEYPGNFHLRLTHLNDTGTDECAGAEMSTPIESN